MRDKPGRRPDRVLRDKPGRRPPACMNVHLPGKLSFPTLTRKPPFFKPVFPKQMPGGFQWLLFMGRENTAVFSVAFQTAGFLSAGRPVNRNCLLLFSLRQNSNNCFYGQNQKNSIQTRRNRASHYGQNGDFRFLYRRFQRLCTAKNRILSFLPVVRKTFLRQESEKSDFYP